MCKVRIAQQRAALTSALALACLLWPMQAPADDEEDDFHLGVIEYELSCLPCHGVDGRGDGPDADGLATRPTDLTTITASNGGIFPSAGLAMVIDGRAIIAAHGPREMPAWGERYRLPVPGTEGNWDVERDARSKIDALVRYIESLQVP